MTEKSKPELLAPAGDRERLEMAVHYGADAVYLAGTRYGMRAAAGNFNDAQLADAIAFCHAHGVRVHVTCNTLPREYELPDLPAYLAKLDALGADALIIADLGVMELARRYAPHVDIHVSTQFGVTSSAAATALYRLGARRAVLAREVSLEEIRRIRRNMPEDMELEAFVHGAMCVSFSGRCVLSNYLTGRDANRGQCAQPCRWKYHLVEETRPGQYFEITEDGGTYILNSRDLCMIDHLQELSQAGIDSFKIEGRMKSAYYAAAVTNAYRHAVDFAEKGEPLPEIWRREVEMVSHRPYSTGFYYGGQPGQHYSESSYTADADVCAVVVSCDPDGHAVLTQRNKFSVGDALNLLTRDHDPCPVSVREMTDAEGNSIDSAPRAMMEVHLQLPFACEPLSILRKLRQRN